MVDGVAVDNSSGRISTDGATLSFSPVDTSDTGNYTCTLTTNMSGTSLTVQGTIQNKVESVSVEGTNIVLLSPCLTCMCLSYLLEYMLHNIKY